MPRRKSDNTKVWTDTHQLTKQISEMTDESIVLVYHKAIEAYFKKIIQEHDSNRPGVIIVQEDKILVVHKDGSTEMIEEDPAETLHTILEKNPTHKIIDFVR